MVNANSNPNLTDGRNNNNISRNVPTNITSNDYHRENIMTNDTAIDADTQSRCTTSEYKAVLNLENNDCEYLKLVMAFKRTLVLPDVFFSYDMAMCYCSSCSASGKNLLEGNLIEI